MNNLCLGIKYLSKCQLNLERLNQNHNLSPSDKNFSLNFNTF